MTSLYTYAWLNENYPYRRDLCGERGCGKYRAWHRDRTWGAEPNMHPFDRWNEEWSFSLCDYCADEAQKSQEFGRREVWRKLPDVMGLLDDWDELEIQQAGMVCVRLFIVSYAH